MRAKVVRTSCVLLAGLAGLWAIHLYLNSPKVIMERLVATCSEGAGWSSLFDRIDPDDKSANGWTRPRFETFLGAVKGNDWASVKVSFAEVVPNQSQHEVGGPSAITWDRHNERNYNIFVAQSSTKEGTPVGVIKLRRHLDGKWYFMSSQVIGVVSKADNAAPHVRYERYIRALKATGMQELWKVRPAEKLTLEALELALSSNGSTALTFTPSP